MLFPPNYRNWADNPDVFYAGAAQTARAIANRSARDPKAGVTRRGFQARKRHCLQKQLPRPRIAAPGIPKAGTARCGFHVRKRHCLQKQRILTANRSARDLQSRDGEPRLSRAEEALSATDGVFMISA